VNEVLVELLRHKSWATISLIELCKTYADLLDTPVPGAYGSVRETLTHIVRSEEGYFFRLTAERLSNPLPEGPAPLDDLIARVELLDPRWEELAGDDELPSHKFTTPDGWIEPGKVILGQAIHHAEVHRTQVLSILGARGVDVPDLSLWEYALATGDSKQIPT
jgi:uncharacterized damage-inducible protein DinB